MAGVSRASESARGASRRASKGHSLGAYQNGQHRHHMGPLSSVGVGHGRASRGVSEKELLVFVLIESRASRARRLNSLREKGGPFKSRIAH